ncbi:hypothetical protein EHS25_000428 [Saitozyma podzolica]|uniref:Uncharacterized protein n=1 Tax=Saitozyma podzolica TaxID=1890683 RepID=A0A427YWK6_9TREE|nr:hypothetical protein EHS25_000428 [Saitozyma podzolica]
MPMPPTPPTVDEPHAWADQSRSGLARGGKPAGAKHRIIVSEPKPKPNPPESRHSRPNLAIHRQATRDRLTRWYELSGFLGWNHGTADTAAMLVAVAVGPGLGR